MGMAKPGTTCCYSKGLIFSTIAHELQSLLPLTTILQAKQCDLVEAAKEAITVNAQLQHERADPEVWNTWLYDYMELAAKFDIKEALYGIEPSTRNRKIWPTREEAEPSVPKKILLNLNQTRIRATLFQSITDVSTTALSRITFKSHELKIATTVITWHACLVSCRSFVHCSAA